MAAINREMYPIIDDFKQLEFHDSVSGITLKYNLFIPTGRDSTKAYPLVLFMHDLGVISDDPLTTLTQGIGGVVWATPAEQAKHESFVLAPQYARQIVNDQSEATEELEVTVRLVQYLVSLYSIDANRLYTTGQSMGCMMSIEMMVRYPDLFAAALLVAGQWDAQRMSALMDAALWIVVSEGDEKAFPGMNDSMAALEAKGAAVSRATWNGRAAPEEFAREVRTMVAEESRIKYTVLRKGTVVPNGIPETGYSNHQHTWPIAYQIDGLRDWLFSQRRQARSYGGKGI